MTRLGHHWLLGRQARAPPTVPTRMVEVFSKGGRDDLEAGARAGGEPQQTKDLEDTPQGSDRDSNDKVIRNTRTVRLRPLSLSYRNACLRPQHVLTRMFQSHVVFIHEHQPRLVEGSWKPAPASCYRGGSPGVPATLTGRPHQCWPLCAAGGGGMLRRRDLEGAGRALEGVAARRP